jgi:hypothetical protein
LILNPGWKHDSALVRELLIEVTYSLSPKDVKEAINKAPELSALKLNNISLSIYNIDLQN